MEGPFDPAAGHRFDRSKILLDPYARAVGGRDSGARSRTGAASSSTAAGSSSTTSTGRATGLWKSRCKDLVIYEMHVRGFTRHASSGVKFPGTFAGIREKIPYLKSLGVNCVELLPIYEFDEFENSRPSPETAEPLLNYWGYSTVGFFAPKAGYAATGKLGMQVDELKALVKELHRTASRSSSTSSSTTPPRATNAARTSPSGASTTRPTTCSRRRATTSTSPARGNTLNCNNPVVRNMVLDCLRYWASEYHIDGFRFDLASILGRDPDGAPLANPPLLESLAYDPVLGKCKLIAEAWDAGGLYQVGSFPAYGRWAEWNGKYRDCIRKFLKGEAGPGRRAGQRACMARPDLYGGRGATASVNFVTCHDGFTLCDLVSYNDKHNEANGEDNSDGANDNH